MDTEILYVIGGAVILYLFLKTNRDKEGRIEDDSVTMDLVVEALEDFVASQNPKLLEGFTEASIQKQLFEHLNKHFVHVNREQGVEGINGLKIDFDIGKGKIGIEVKLARALFKSASLQRLVGQMADYMNNKYKNDNLIVAVFGTGEEAKQRVYLSAIKEKIEELAGAKYVFCKIKDIKKVKTTEQDVDN